LETEKPVVIVNPKSGGGLSERRWAALVAPLTDGLGAFDTRFTESVGDGRRLAHEEASGGRQLVVAFGGDGTISEVADGIMAARGGKGAGTGSNGSALGIIPRGTGGDFRRTLALPNDVTRAAKHLRAAPTHQVDMGRATFVTDEGVTATRHFINLASFGFSADAARRANSSHKRFGAKLAFLGATMGSLMGYDNVEVIVTIDGGEPRRQTALLGAIGNGCFFGGGMKICPTGCLDDGLLDVVVIGDVTRGYVMRKLSTIYAGNHLSLPPVSSVRARKVEVAPVPGSPPIPIELDGETPGFLPATFEVLPSVLGLRF
jgi:diacylglycerol kinase (ATP)